MNNLLLEERPLMVLPSLVKAYGFERAAILQQIHWLCQQPKIGIQHDGYKWVWGKYEELCEEYFSFWEPRTLRYHVAKLEEDGVLVSGQLKADKWDRTKFYRIAYEKLTMRQHVAASERQCIDVSEGHHVAASLYTKTSSKSISSHSTNEAHVTAKRGKSKGSIQEPLPMPSPPVPSSPPSAQQEWFGEVCTIIGWDYKTLSKASAGQVAQTVGILQKAGYTIEELRRFRTEVMAKDWRWKEGKERPTIKQLREEIGRIRTVGSTAVIGKVEAQVEIPEWLR